RVGRRFPGRPQRSVCRLPGLHDSRRRAARGGGRRRVVAHAFWLVQPQSIEIDDVDVGAQSQPEPAAVAEEIRGFASLHLCILTISGSTAARPINPLAMLGVASTYKIALRQRPGTKQRRNNIAGYRYVRGASIKKE